MKSTPHNPNSSAPGAGEKTLRLIAGLPAPAGLEDRVHAALRAAPRRGRVLAWPAALKPQSSWMRTAAAAAIVFVIAGGGWGVYTRVQQNQPAGVIVMPQRVVSPGGFSGAGAMRTPQTLAGPTVISQPVTPKPAQPRAVQPKVVKKPAAPFRERRCADPFSTCRCVCFAAVEIALAASTRPSRPPESTCPEAPARSHPRRPGPVRTRESRARRRTPPGS